MEKYNDLKKVFERNNMKFKSFPSKEEAVSQIMKDIRLDEDITIGGSMTMEELGIYEELADRGNNVLWHWRPEDKKEVNKNIYLSSSNAITEDGKLLNMDGTGNRVSAMIYGYERVFIIVGKNKIRKNYEEASRRMKEIAAPLNAKRLNLSTPCVKTGVCSDCNSPDRICGAEVIIHRALRGVEMNIYLIDENLGF